MGRALITTKDIFGKLPKSLTIRGTARTDGLLTISTPGLGASQILPRFEAAINRASQRIATDLEAVLGAALSSNVWQTPSGRADIIDSGELLSSGSVTIDQSGVTIAYTAPYAALVHYGGYINPYGNASTRVYLPPRPWVESVLFGGGPVPQFDFVSYYTDEISREFS